MQYVSNAIRRLMFPVLMTTIIGGLWVAASEREGTEMLRIEASSLEFPVVVQPRLAFEHDPNYVVADDGSIAAYSDPT